MEYFEKIWTPITGHIPYIRQLNSPIKLQIQVFNPSMTDLYVYSTRETAGIYAPINVSVYPAIPQNRLIRLNE